MKQWPLSSLWIVKPRRVYNYSMSLITVLTNEKCMVVTADGRGVNENSTKIICDENKKLFPISKRCVAFVTGEVEDTDVDNLMKTIRALAKDKLSVLDISTIA